MENKINESILKTKFSERKSFERKEGGEKRWKPFAEPLFEQNLLNLSRVSNTKKGGRRFSFVALMLIVGKPGSENNSKIGISTHKSKNVPDAIKGAFRKAIKGSKIFFPEKIETIPFDIKSKFNSTKMILKPTSSGSGIKASSILSPIIRALGIKNITVKTLGSKKNKYNVIRCFLKALWIFTRKKIDF